jgi:hypothetical protein
VTTHRRGPRDLSLRFNWRAELGSLMTGMAWICGTLLVWRIALFVTS